MPDAAVLVEERDSIRLAFVAALQHLPARQRAVLILRDVLRWSAAEVADALDTTTAAVNSALQRAHAQIEARRPTRDTVADDLDADQRRLLERYVEAFWRKDVDEIVSLLTIEATWEMPPFTGWYRGAETIGRLIGTQCPGGSHDMPMLPTRANGQPAFGLYMRTPAGDFEPFQLQVLDLDGDRVRHVSAFFDTALFATFGLPDRLPARRAGGRRAVTRGLAEPDPTDGSDDPARAVELLERALGYTRVVLADVAEPMLGRPTPCAGWTLGELLRHMEDALDAFAEAAAGRVWSARGAGAGAPAGGRPGGRPAAPGLPAARRLERAAGRGGAGRDRRPGRSPARGWWAWPRSRSPCTAGTSGQATGRRLRIPASLAAELLVPARRLVRPEDRGLLLRPAASDPGWRGVRRPPAGLPGSRPDWSTEGGFGRTGLAARRRFLA